MLKPKINFIGCGRVGKTLAWLLKKNNVASIGGIICTTYDNALLASQFIGDGKPCNTLKDLPCADIYFITTGDSLIQNSCDNLISTTISNAIILHCSGALSSDILINAKNYECHVASIHPIKSFANPKESINNFKGTYCAIEGDERAITYVGELFQKIGANVFNIKKELKPLYHAASVIANNYMVTLHNQAVQCYQSIGLDQETAKQITSMLALDAIHNINKMNHVEALTGPIQRGDVSTIQNNINSLNAYPLIKNIYISLGLGTLSLTSHTQDKLKEIESILTLK